MWLDMHATTLTALGLLFQDEEATLVLPGSSRKALSSHSDAYMGHIIQHMTHIATRWLQLDNSVCAGHRMAGPEGDIQMGIVRHPTLAPARPYGRETK